MDLLIAKTGVAYAKEASGAAIALIGDADRLLAGSLAAFDDSGTLIAHDASAITGDHVTFAMGTSVGPVFSTPVYRRHFSYNKTFYLAPAKKIMCLGTNASAGTTYNLNLPASFLKGDTVGVDIIDFSKPIENTVRRVNVSIVCGGGETQAQVVAALVAAINADKRVNTVVVAVDLDSNHDGIQFTAYAVTSNFTVLGTDLLVNADVIEYQNIIYTPIAGSRGYLSTLTAGLAPFIGGTGSSTQMSKMELDASAGHGNINSEMYAADLWSMPSVVVPGQTYNTYACKHVAKPTQPLINETNFDQWLVIGIPATGTTVGLDYYDGSTTPPDGIGFVIEKILALVAANV